jgi:hypothetical protein
MVGTITLSKETGTHKPLVTGSNPVAATTKYKSASIDQGTGQNPQTYLAVSTEQGITLKQAVNSFLISCLATTNLT